MVLGATRFEFHKYRGSRAPAPRARRGARLRRRGVNLKQMRGAVPEDTQLKCQMCVSTKL